MDKIWLKDGKFIELIEEQVKNLSEDQLAAYIVEESTKEDKQDLNKKD